MNKKSTNRNKAFTLAEIMIVLTVIGIITGILMPVAINSSPDEKVMKFKKANATLVNVITKLVRSDQYYKDGDLGIRADGSRIRGDSEADLTYFCNSLADNMSNKSVNCSKANTSSIGATQYFAILNVEDGVYQSTLDAKNAADSSCKQYASAVGAEIVTPDGVVYYQTAPNYTFGISWKKSNTYNGDTTCDHPANASVPVCSEDARLFSGPDYIWHQNSQGLDRVYKIFCIDVDGIPPGGSESCDDVSDICPFGYGIRADGRILSGARADEWMAKSLQKGNNE